MGDVSLRPMTLSDTDNIIRWRNSDAVRLNMQDQRMLNSEQHQDYYIKQILTGKVVQYIILANSISIGTVFYKYLNKKQVELGIFIGEIEYIGKGYGRESFNLLLQEIQKNEEIKQLFVKVNDSNIRAINLYRNSGFEKCKSEKRNFVVMRKNNNNDI